MENILKRKLDAIAKKYAHEFKNCDVVRISDLQVDTPGDFLPLLKNTIPCSNIISFPQKPDLNTGSFSSLTDLSVLDVISFQPACIRNQIFQIDEELNCAMSLFSHALSQVSERLTNNSNNRPSPQSRIPSGNRTIHEKQSFHHLCYSAPTPFRSSTKRRYQTSERHRAYRTRQKLCASNLKKFRSFSTEVTPTERIAQWLNHQEST
ncbi:unnamed protein product [Dicrocoelium dendriticum]|nr:unnamed protein product [Dicrocoelium dendriticum]